MPVCIFDGVIPQASTPSAWTKEIKFGDSSVIPFTKMSKKSWKLFVRCRPSQRSSQTYVEIMGENLCVEGRRKHIFLLRKKNRYSLRAHGSRKLNICAIGLHSALIPGGWIYFEQPQVSKPEGVLHSAWGICNDNILLPNNVGYHRDILRPWPGRALDCRSYPK